MTRREATADHVIEQETLEVIALHVQRAVEAALAAALKKKETKPPPRGRAADRKRCRRPDEAAPLAGRLPWQAASTVV